MQSDPSQHFRPLPKTHSRDGFALRQIQRTGNVAIFAQSRPGQPPLAWEVVRIRVRRAHPRDPDQSPRESYPGDNAWGIDGWTCLTLATAQARAANVR